MNYDAESDEKTRDDQMRSSYKADTYNRHMVMSDKYRRKDHT